MALKLGTLFFDFNADTSKLKKKQKEIIKTNEKVSRSFDIVGRSIVAAFSLEVLRRTVIMVDAVGLLDIRIKNATKSQRDFNRAQKELLRITIQTGSSLSDNVRLFEAFTIAGKELRATNDQVLLLTENINKLGIIGASSAQALSNATLQLGQALAGGIVRAEEFNSILENTPLIAEAIADGFNISIGALRKMVLEGNLLSEDVFNKILGQTDKINKRFEKFPLTVAIASKSLKTVWQDNLKDVDNVLGVTEKIAKVIKIISDAVEDNFKPAVNSVLKLFVDMFSSIENGIVRFSAGLKIIGIEVDRQFKLFSGKNDEFFDNQIALIERNRDAAIEANKKVTDDIIENNRKRLIDPEIIKPGKTARKVLGAEGLKTSPVSEIDKIIASMGNETQAILNALQERNNKILELTDIGEQNRRDLLLESGKLANRQMRDVERARQEVALNSLSQFNDSFLTVLKAGGKDQTAVAKAIFLANQAIQVATIIAETQVGAAKAVGQLGPFGIPLAAIIEATGFARAGLVAGLAIGQTFSGGGRQAGGPAFAGAIHPINENGGPEVFQQGARQFLLPGSKSGVVTPLSAANDGGGGVVVNINNQVAGLDITSNVLSRNEVEIMIRESEDRAVGRVDESLSQGRGTTFTALRQGTKIERNIR